MVLFLDIRHGQKGENQALGSSAYQPPPLERATTSDPWMLCLAAAHCNVLSSIKSNLCSASPASPGPSGQCSAVQWIVNSALEVGTLDSWLGSTRNAVSTSTLGLHHPGPASSIQSSPFPLSHRSRACQDDFSPEASESFPPYSIRRPSSPRPLLSVYLPVELSRLSASRSAALGLDWLTCQETLCAS